MPENDPTYDKGGILPAASLVMASTQEPVRRLSAEQVAAYERAFQDFIEEG